MILDTSAIVAILLAEPGHEQLIARLGGSATVGVGAPTLAEATIVLSARLGRDARGLLARFLQEASIAVVPFGDAHVSTAVDAWLRFGKGRHSAGLNLGDCLTYATASLAGESLLSTGNDFAQTDIPVV